MGGSFGTAAGKMDSACDDAGHPTGVGRVSAWGSQVLLSQNNVATFGYILASGKRTGSPVCQLSVPSRIIRCTTSAAAALVSDSRSPFIQATNI